MKFLIPLLASFSLFASSPDFLVLGAQKGGTTSLYSYLQDHPDFVMPEIKELRFFNVYFEKGKKYYFRQFPRKNKKGLPFSGDVTPSYLPSYVAPKRAYQLCPHAKLIAILRNPVDRAFSRYKKRLQAGETSKSFETLVHQELAYLKGSRKGIKPHFDFLELGLYAEQLKRWLAFYPKEQLLILISEDFYANTQECMDKVYDHLGVAPHIHESFPVENQGTLKLTMKSETRALLEEFYRPYNDELQKLFDELQIPITLNWNKS